VRVGRGCEGDCKGKCDGKGEGEGEALIMVITCSFLAHFG
jgi:hypothetical protein